jgi:hypothetical protein
VQRGYNKRATRDVAEDGKAAGEHHSPQNISAEQPNADFELGASPPELIFDCSSVILDKDALGGRALVVPTWLCIGFTFLTTVEVTMAVIHECTGILVGR